MRAEQGQSADQLTFARVLVTDRSVQKLVNGLQARQFRLTEGGQPRPIEFFSDRPGPVSLAVVLDMSGSMWDMRGRYREWAQSIVDTQIDCGEWVVIAVGLDMLVLKAFSDSSASAPLHDGPGESKSTVDTGGTSLFDALLAAAESLRTVARYPSRAIVVVSDGEDSRSRYGYKELQSRLETYGIRVYYVGAKGELGYGERILRDLARSTGGFGVYPRLLNCTVALALIQKYVTAQQHEYVLGYHSSVDVDERREKLRVQVPGMKVTCWFTVSDPASIPGGAR